MTGRLLFNIYTLLIFSSVKSCFLPESIQVSVPQTIPAGYMISKVNVDNCDTKSLHFTLSDPDFTVTSEGTIVAVSTVMMTFRGRTFSVWAQDASGQNSEMKVNIVHNTVQKKMVKNTGFLKRYKRRWSPPPFNVVENQIPPFPKDIDVIASDSQASYRVYYTISGPGVTENPVDLFSVDRNTGMLRVHKSVDREEFPQIVFVARVFDKDTNKETDLPLDITVVIEDVNDNSPQFAAPLQFTVPEHSKLGTEVGTVKATDRDQANTPHTKIEYSFLVKTDLFMIHPETGLITTASDNLDREVQDKHVVTVQIKDMGGKAGGLSNTGTATIILGDINDNPPTFLKTSYAVSVEENKSEQLILRIPVEDKDLINTPNWNSEFLITEGNENQNFRIERDPKTNEGLLYVTKPLDYETKQKLNLRIKARNTADLTNTKADWPSIPVNVTVVNVDEGPEFTAPTVRFLVKENTPNGTLIGTYTALDPDNKSSAGIKYYKTIDPASWVNVDLNSGELRVANTIDRESHFVQGGIYNVTMKAVDARSKTGTGTVIIQVEDVNDNMPEFPTGELVLCEKTDGDLGSLTVAAKDLDQPPFSAPFSFELGDKNDGKWAVKKFNDTAAVLQQTKVLPTGLYTVPVVVKDLQGFGRTQMVQLRICQCRYGACLTKPSSISLGPMAILAMLLPLFLLLLLCILLALFCVTKEEKIDLMDMGDSGGVLLKSNIEAPGEEVDSRLILDSTDGNEQKQDLLLNSGWIGNKSTSTIGRHSALDSGLHQSSGVMMTDSQNAFFSSQYGNQFGTGQFSGNRFGGTNMSFNNGQLFQDSSVYQTWQTNGRYIQEKLMYMGKDAEDRYADDIIHSYGFEGRGSAAGSVGCCSDQGPQDNLDFLNTLGPKFKTLAEVCTKKQ